MKKIVFLLLAVLLLGTFVACDGEADFLLWDNEPASHKTLKLKLDNEEFSFEGGEVFVGEIELAVDDSVETWADLIAQIEIPLFYQTSIGYEELPVVWDSGSDFVELYYTGYWIYVKKQVGGEYVSITNKTEEIDFDSQFLLTPDF